MADLPRLYLITSGDLAVDPLLTALEAALCGGLALVQLREKQLTTAALLRLARQVQALTRRYGAELLINSRTDVALALGAGVHLTSNDPPVAHVRALLGPGPLIGVSTHHADETVSLAAEGASFATCGPVYDTPSKRGMGMPIGLSGLSQVVTAASVPVLALGGIDPSRVAPVMATGCHGVGVIRAIWSAADPADAVHIMAGQVATARARRQQR